MSSAKVFISYKSDEFATADWVRQTLEDHGISCWMAPACIPGGSNYAREIPQAIRACRVFVLILSAKSQTSQWVPKEVDQAINMQKTIMPFMLENCELRDDFNFYLSNVQRYAAYENKMRAMDQMIREIRAILDADEAAERARAEADRRAAEQAAKAEAERLAAEQAAKAEAERLAAEQTAKAERETTEDATAKLAIAGEKAVEQQPRSENNTEANSTDTATKPDVGNGRSPAAGQAATEKKDAGRAERTEKTRMPAPVPETKPEQKKSRNWKIIAVAAAVLVLAAAFALLTSNRVVIAGKEYKRSATSVSISEQTLTEKDIQAFSKLRKLRQVELKSCQLEGTDLSPLLSEEVWYIALPDCKLSREQIDSLDLSGTSVSYLNLNGNTNLDSLQVITPVRDKLRHLDIGETSVSGLQALADCPKLETLNINGVGAENLSMLTNLTELKEVHVSRNGLTSLQGLEQALRLEHLEAAENELRDLEGLENATVLKKVDLSGNSLSEIGYLKKSSGTITQLRLAGNKLTDGDVFASFPALEYLNIDNNQVVSLTGLDQCALLEKCSAAGNQLSKVTEFEQMPGLKYLNLANNRITELKLPAYESNVTLELSGNPLMKLELTEGTTYRYLGLADMQSGNWETLCHLKADTLITCYDADMDYDRIRDGGTYRILLIDCPLDQQVKLEETLSNHVEFVSAEEAAEAAADFIQSYE